MSDSETNLKMVLLITRIFLFLVLGSLAALLIVFGAPLLIWAMIAFAALLLAVVVIRHAHRTAYACRRCDEHFRVDAWIDFVSPHMGAVKLLRCPKCGAVSWCEAGRDLGSHSRAAGRA